jgi:hypothetical protein
VVRMFRKHSVPQVSEYPKHWPSSSQHFFEPEPVTSWETFDEMALCSEGLRAGGVGLRFSLLVPYER